MRLDGHKPCPICGKRRGAGIDHSRCSRKLQAQHEADKAQPHRKRDGTIATFPNGQPITEAHCKKVQYKLAKKKYRKPDSYWSNID